MKRQLLQVVIGVLAAAALCGALLLASEALWPTARTVVAADATRGLDHIVVHFDPPAAPLVRTTYSEIFAALPHSKVTVVVASEADFQTFLETFAPAEGERGRFEPVLTGRPITTWSRDRYTLALEGEQRVLLVPAQRPSLVDRRANDWLVPFRLAEAEGIEVGTQNFDFDGGDLIVGPDVVFADTNLMRKNPDRFRTPAAVRHQLEVMLGRPVVVLGEQPEDVPHHHIGMYLTPLPNGAVAVGSPTLAADLLGAQGLEAMAARLASADMPKIDLTPETVERFDGPARQLEAAGFRVVRLPLVPLDDQVTFITYNNGVTHHDADGLHFLMPAYSVEALDARATAILEAEGLKVHPIDVRTVFQQHGSVRCLVNVL